MEGIDAGIRKADDMSEQVCFRNREAGPGGCFNQEPACHFRLESLLSAFAIIQRGRGLIYAGMAGTIVGVDWCQVESVARGFDLPWDETTQEQLSELTSAWLEELWRKQK